MSKAQCDCAGERSDDHTPHRLLNEGRHQRRELGVQPACLKIVGDDDVQNLESRKQGRQRDDKRTVPGDRTNEQGRQHQSRAPAVPE